MPFFQKKPKKKVFLGHDELKYVSQLRGEKKFDEAQDLLLKAEPSPAVLDELRKIASARAKLAKKDGNWGSVIQHLEGYTAYANEWRDYCVKIANQDPPSHTESDVKLLQEARGKLKR